MTNLLQKTIVLVLNRYWQAIDVKTPAEAFCMLAAGSAAGLNIFDGHFLPTKWDEWLTLPVREGDYSAATVRGAIRIPTVIIAINFARVPIRRLAFGRRGIWERDGGTCQYTGRKLSPEEANIDHVIPRARGGGTTWENCVLAHREVNTRKADRLPAEAGLRLQRVPTAPRPRPVSAFIRNQHEVSDWEHFLRE